MVQVMDEKWEGCWVCTREAISKTIRNKRYERGMKGVGEELIVCLMLVNYLIHNKGQK